MTARKVITWPDSRLLEKSKQVLCFDDSLKELALDLSHTMVASFGAGLAATQIGESRAMCVISRDYALSLPIEKKLQGNFIVLVNPIITQVEDSKSDKFIWEEGCLSVPDVTAKVSRLKTIQITYQNLEGSWVEKIVHNEESATIQHEVDHLTGKLFIHRLQGLQKRHAIQRLRREVGIDKRKKSPEERDEKVKSRICKKKKSRAKKKKTFGKNKNRK